jgi:DNA-binding transcriptional ArsR family regulator
MSVNRSAAGSGHESDLPVTEPSALPSQPFAPRRVDDAPTLRALAHPIRLALLEALSSREPLSATEAAEMIGESPSACSFHFRMLAKYGLVEDAGGSTGRRRPWRRASPAGFMLPTTSEDAQAQLAAGALSDVVWGRYLNRARAVLGRRLQLAAQQGAVTSAAQTVAYVKPAEAASFLAELQELIGRYQPRLADPSLRPADSVALELLLFTYPLDAVPPGA